MQLMIKKRKKSSIFFNLILIVSLVIFVLILYSQTNLFSDLGKNIKPIGKPTYTPSKLTWFEHFRGIENIPKSKDKNDSSSSGGSTGFNYQGFKK